MEVTRWSRYGKDRLYVKDEDGIEIGWWDLQEDVGHPAGPDTLALLRVSVADWRARAAESSSGPVVEPSMVEGPGAHASAPPHAPLVVDLIYNRPGEQLAAKIAEAREAGKQPTLWRRFWLGKNAYSTWERGAIGERLVAHELGKLVQKDARWGYLNSIPVSDCVDIDLFVVGPGGVFTINAKYHRGARIWVGGDTLMVNGTRQPYVRNSRHEARRASRLLTRAIGHPISVQGLVVPVDADKFNIKAQPDDVHVINRRRLNSI